MLRSAPSHSYFYVHSALYLIIIWHACFHIRVILSPEKYLQNRDDPRWYTLSSLCLQTPMWSQLCTIRYTWPSLRRRLWRKLENPNPTQHRGTQRCQMSLATERHLESWLDPVDHQVKESMYVGERRVFLKSALSTLKELCKRPSKLREISSKEAILGQNQ